MADRSALLKTSAGRVLLVAALLSIPCAAAIAADGRAAVPETCFFHVITVANRHMGHGGLSDGSMDLSRWILGAIRTAGGEPLFSVFPRDGKGRMLVYVEVPRSEADHFSRTFREAFAEFAGRWSARAARVYGECTVERDPDPRFQVRLVFETQRRKLIFPWQYHKETALPAGMIAVPTLLDLRDGGWVDRLPRKPR